MVVAEKFESVEAFRCEECGLHFTERREAERCESWCERHDSCNFEITGKSLESELSTPT